MKKNLAIFSVPEAILVFEPNVPKLTIQRIIQRIGALEEVSGMKRTSSNEITISTKNGDNPEVWGEIRAHIDGIIASQPMIPDPKIGSRLYVPATDEKEGGLAKISRIEDGVSAGEAVIYAYFEGIHRSRFNYHALLEMQEELKARYRRQKARAR